MVTFIVGLPGSGKSYLGNSMENVHFIDDVSMVGLKAIEKHKDKDLVIADVYLCLEEEREKAVRTIKRLIPDCQINWIFFENNPEQCLKNVCRRMQQGDDRKVAELIKVLSKKYNPKENTRKVWCHDGI